MEMSLTLTNLIITHTSIQLFSFSLSFTYFYVQKIYIKCSTMLHLNRPMSSDIMSHN